MKRYGHRGACGHAPENTLASFRKALELGVDGYEFDIQLSKDGEPVIIHDDTLERTISAKGAVSAYTYEELKQFRTKDSGEAIPHLDDIFALSMGQCDLLIELKAYAVEPVERCIRAWVAKGWDYANIWVLCFDHAQLVAIKKLNPNIQTGALIEGIPVSLAQVAVDAGAQALCPYVGSMNQALIDDAHKHGLKVFTWTANKPRDIERARALGVDGIMSDYPERL